MSFLESMDNTQKIIFGLALVTLLVAIYIFFTSKSSGRDTNEGMKAQRMPTGGGQGAEPPLSMQPMQQPSMQQAPTGGEQQESGKMLVLFFAPWCGHCKNLEPIWNELTQNFDGLNGVRIVKVNGDENSQLTQVHGVQGFPTIKFCPNGLKDNTGEVYQGPRDLQSLAQFLQQNA